VDQQSFLRMSFFLKPFYVFQFKCQAVSIYCKNIVAYMWRIRNKIFSSKLQVRVFFIIEIRTVISEITMRADKGFDFTF